MSGWRISEASRRCIAIDFSINLIARGNAVTQLIPQIQKRLQVKSQYKVGRLLDGGCHRYHLFSDSQQAEMDRKKTIWK